MKLTKGTFAAWYVVCVTLPCVSGAVLSIAYNSLLVLALSVLAIIGFIWFEEPIEKFICKKLNIKIIKYDFTRNNIPSRNDNNSKRKNGRS